MRLTGFRRVNLTFLLMPSLQELSEHFSDVEAGCHGDVFTADGVDKQKVPTDIYHNEWNFSDPFLTNRFKSSHISLCYLFRQHQTHTHRFSITFCVLIQFPLVTRYTHVTRKYRALADLDAA